MVHRHASHKSFLLGSAIPTRAPMLPEMELLRLDQLLHMLTILGTPLLSAQLHCAAWLQIFRGLKALRVLTFTPFWQRAARNSFL